MAYPSVSLQVADASKQLTIMGERGFGGLWTITLDGLGSSYLNNLPWKPLPFGPQSKVTFEIHVNASQKYTMVWTADTFGDAALPLVSEFRSNIVEIQFAQRCLLCNSGHVTWYLRISTNGISYAAYTAIPHGKPSEDSPANFPVNLREIKAIGPPEFAVDCETDAIGRELKWFGGRFSWHGKSSLVARLVENELRYFATGALISGKDFSISDGFVLYASDNPILEIWQPCTWTASGQSRKITLGINNIPSKTALRAWTEHVARRYYDGLALQQGFTLLPELSLPDNWNQAADPSWAVTFFLLDRYPLSSDPNQWNWQDNTQEYAVLQPDLDPAGAIVAHLQTVQIMGVGSLQSITATLRRFRTQDGTPLILNGLTLKTDPKISSNESPWSLQLEGKASSSGETVVRAGGLALKFFGAQPSTQSLRMTFEAEYPAVDPTFPPGARMPVVGCHLDKDFSLPLYDVIPAAEDDQLVDEYAQLNIGTDQQSQDTYKNLPLSDRQKLDQIFNNMQREQSIVFRNPAEPSTSPDDGAWWMLYDEQSDPAARPYVSMRLGFTPSDSRDKATIKGESVLVFSRNPFSFADVHYHPLNDLGASEVAEWNSVTNEWRIKQIEGTPSYLVMPPQIIAEENITSKASYPKGLPPDTSIPQMAMGLPTVVTYATEHNRATEKLPWDLHRLLNDRSLNVRQIDYEMLYGMPASTTADHMRLVEAAILFGDLLGEFPQYSPDNVDFKSTPWKDCLNARLYWSRIHREYCSRLGIYVVQDSTSSNEESFTDTSNTVAYLRTDDKGQLPVMSDPNSGQSHIQDYVQPSLVSHTPDGAKAFHGGALDGLEEQPPEIYRGVVNLKTTGIGNAAVVDPRFSAVGGFGLSRGRFGTITLINSISMGRTVTYTVEQVGRIACHWNRAKHVIVYERTVVPSRQFYLEQDEYRGLPLVRKVEEYVEFLEPERVYAEESTPSHAAFAHGFKCGEKKRVSVDSSWGSVVPGQGWKVPLWSARASQQLPDVYPKPQFYLEVTSPEKAVDSTDAQPNFLTRDALLTHPEQVFFYTSFAEGFPPTNEEPDTDKWKPVEGVDCVGYPLITPDDTIYDQGDLNAIPLPEFATPPGWEPVTFHIAPPDVGVHITAGVVKSSTPMTAQLTHVTVSRGPEPTPITVQKLLDTTALNTYKTVAPNVSTISQALTGIRDALQAGIANPNPAQTAAAIRDKLTVIGNAANNLGSNVSSVANGLQDSVTSAFKTLGTQLQEYVRTYSAPWLKILQQLQTDITAAQNTPQALDHSRILAIDHLRQVFKDSEAEINSWGSVQESKVTAVVRKWSDEIENVVTSYAQLLHTPIGELSPLRRLSATVNTLSDDITNLQIDVASLNLATFANWKTLDDVQAGGADLVHRTQEWQHQFDASASRLTQSLTDLQHIAQKVDPSLVLLALRTATLTGQFQAITDASVQAATAKVSAAQSEVTQDEKQIVDAATNAFRAALAPLQTSLITIQQNLSTAKGILSEKLFDPLRCLAQPIAALYSDDLATCRSEALAICEAPQGLIKSLSDQGTATANKIISSIQNQLDSLALQLTQWLAAQATSLAGPIGDLQNQLNAIRNNVDSFVQNNLSALQSQLDSMAGQARAVGEQTAQLANQYVRTPLLNAYQSLASSSQIGAAMRVVRAFGAPPQAPNLNIQPPSIAYLYREADAHVGITPVLARANQVGQVLNALGVQLPAKQLADRLIPAPLQNFQLSDILPNFAGLHLPGLFQNIKLPAVATDNIKVTHGWEPQARRTWLQADASVPFTDSIVVFQLGFLSFLLNNARFTATSRIETVGLSAQQSTNGSIVGTWNFEIGGSENLISFASTELSFDDKGKLQFHFRPDSITFSQALHSITELMGKFTDPDSGFSYGCTPTGVKCAFALPVPDIVGGTSGISGLRIYTSLTLDYATDFTITLAVAVSSKDRPFNFAIFILGGCGYLQAGVTYNVSNPKGLQPSLDLAIGCSASLAIALGPITGGVYAQFGIESRLNAGRFRIGAFFQITGHVSICGIISVDLVFRLEASYGNGVMEASGYFSITVKLFMFSFSVSRDVSMRLGSHGQESGRLRTPFDRSLPPGNEVAALDGAGMAAAFAAADTPTPAQRYISLLF